MTVRFPLVTLSALAALWMSGCAGDVTQGDGNAAPAGQVDVFAQRIAPILESSCGCHTNGSADGGVSLGGYTAAMGHVVKGDAASSPLLASMTVTDGVNSRYSSGDAELIRAWIDSGAPRYGEADTFAPGGPSGYAGISSCANHCHGEVREEWLHGPHGNLEEMDENHQDKGLGLDSLGFPYFGMNGMGEAGSSCSTACHDQLGDGGQLAEGLTGNEPRPVVGCESCHGAGGDHLAIDYPKPGPEQCGLCHNSAFDHNTYHPEGDNVIEDYAASPHSRSINDRVLAEEGSADVRARCSRCHTDEGAKEFLEVTGGPAELSAALPNSLPPVANASPVQCRTCHDRHDPDKLLFGADVDDEDGDGVLQSAEFRTCTHCHQTADSYHGESSSYAWSSHTVGVGTFDNSGRINYDTHYDDPATMEIEGYVLDVEGERTCRDCHNQHAADNTINDQWARSGHGGRIALVKEAAASSVDAADVLTAGVDDAAAPAWAHYSWGAEYRSSCARCHTATGVVAFLSSPDTYDPAVDIEYVNGAMSHLEFVTNDGSDAVVYANRVDNLTGIEKEMLYCWACHVDRSGAVRDPGAVTPDYTDTPFPDVGPSNLCLACHMGRESGDIVADSTDDFSDKRFVNSHYLSAGGTVFRTTGYEFPGLDYSNVSFYRHGGIGTTELDDNGETVEVYEGTGRAGPCVGCHMGAAQGSAPNHLFLPFIFSETGAITEITNPVCATCHRATETRDTTLTPEFLNEEREYYEDALHALEDQLAADGYAFLGGYPYFGAKNWLSDSDGDGVTRIDSDGDGVADSADPEDAWTGPLNMGAAFNFNLLHHDPGGFAHNRYYVKRLIYDSIDWLDDNLLNDSVAVTLDALDDATSYKSGAATYLASIGR